MRFRSLVFTALIATALDVAAAQAPVAGPLILRLPASTRATPLGNNSWVAGRDEDVVFYNPALIAGRTGFNASLTRYAPGNTQAGFAGGYAAGPWSLALGWGMQLVHFSADPSEAYPFAPEALTRSGTVDATSALGTVGASISLKGFRIGAAAKYAFDQRENADREGAFLVDAGISRPFLGGVAAIAAQNLGNDFTNGPAIVAIPMQGTLAWTGVKSTDQVDFGLAGHVTVRDGWVSPGGGVEISYGWIEAWSASLRVGAHKTETKAEKPLAIGGTLNADHLSLEYALQFFEGGRYVNRMTLRWR